MKKGVKYCVGIATALVCGWFLLSAGQAGDFKLGRNIEILINMFRDVSLFYVDQVDPDELLEDAARGMTSGLDPYTEFLPEQEMENFEVMTTGKYGGIGAIIRQKGDYVVIAQPYKDSPADKADLKVGDKIVSIDGKDAKGMDVGKVSSMLKGDPGTKVKLRVEKFMDGQEVPVTITRERISIPGVPYSAFVADGIGYIQHSDFTENCSDELRKAFMEMKKSGNLQGLILDYRNNGGGILQEAVKILSFFLPKGTEVVSMRGKQAQANAVYKTQNEPLDLDIPIVVLVNGSSASAAEIVSGALQDMDRAVLAGQRTFGKGLVQGTKPLGYNTMLKITTSKYYIPSGRCIQAIDYARRNEDGSVDFVPDSLVREYTTQAGRKVYDGGGVMPDVRIKPEYTSRFAMVVYAKGYIDDFVDEYMRRNPGPVDLARFSLGDDGYASFVEFMADKDVEFTSETKKALDELKRKAERERYIDSISGLLDQMRKNIADDKDANLALYRNELTELIEDDIILRRHYAQGVTERSLKTDKEVAAAVSLLRDRERYNTIITSQDTDRK